MSKTVDNYEGYELGEVVIARYKAGPYMYKMEKADTLREGDCWFWARSRDTGLIYHWCYKRDYKAGKRNGAPNGYCNRCNVQLAPGWVLLLTIGGGT